MAVPGDEIAFLDEVHAALARMLDTAAYRVETGAMVAGDRYTAEVLGRMLKSHLKELREEPEAPPYFGALHLMDGERHRIGRRRVADAQGTPLVLDWRAPVSRAFYQARASDPQGVRVRRRYGWSGLTLTGYEDEPLTDGRSLSRLVTEEIERPRVGPMRDIVATIQPDQDDLVRAGLGDSVCVQGAPGTGKTAVGLHRAAYLLYAHRRQLERTGVLVLGPSRVFLDYVSAVLPALGEVRVEQRTLPGLLDLEITGTDPPEAAAVKHDVRMAGVLERALWSRIAAPAAPLTVLDGSYRWRIPVFVIERLVAGIRAEGPRYGVGRERLRARIVALMQRQAERRGETPGYAWQQRTSRAAPVRELLDQVWPRITPAELVAELLSDPVDTDLSDAERAAIRWPRRRSARAARWTEADTLLIDEAAGLIDALPGFGHIIVDEAQDLSPMQCRAIARRSTHGSLTVLGDLAQGTTPWAATSWRAQLGHLGRPDAPVTPLTAGFRVPAAVLAVANRLLGPLGVDVPPARSVRADGVVRFLPGASVHDTALAALDHEGSVAVIAASVDGLSLPSSPRLTALPAALAKGLEFDHVIVVEPTEIVDAEPRGLNRLYVVLTRAVSRLDVIHSRPLPAALEEASRQAPQ
ncbi:HelD family protein [Catenuloplanes japonicus]|uniref:HelD family protein n=1 Tax=Catenuloplanes japonicus TaxID=33876 RepID=UPI0005270ED3|nr:AAA family ATPase [Catenuloplanes japonicus]